MSAELLTVLIVGLTIVVILGLCFVLWQEHTSSHEIRAAILWWNRPRHMLDNGHSPFQFASHFPRVLVPTFLIPLTFALRIVLGRSWRTQ
jgi:hypothetical protein